MTAITYHVLNETGLADLEALLRQRHRSFPRGVELTKHVLHDFAEPAAEALDDGLVPVIELRSEDTVSGQTELIILSRASFDAWHDDEEGF